MTNDDEAKQILEELKKIKKDLKLAWAWIAGNTIGQVVIIIVETLRRL